MWGSLDGHSSPHDVTEKEMRKPSENCGKAGKVSVRLDKGFGFTRLEIRTLEEIAKVDLDNLPLEESSSAYAYSLQSSSLRIQGTKPFLFGQVESCGHRA